ESRAIPILEKAKRVCVLTVMKEKAIDTRRRSLPSTWRDMVSMCSSNHAHGDEVICRGNRAHRECDDASEWRRYERQLLHHLPPERKSDQRRRIMDQWRSDGS